MRDTNEFRDLEDGELMARGRRRRGNRKNLPNVTSEQHFSSPSRNSGYGGSGATGGRDSALSGRLSQVPLYGETGRNKRKSPNFNNQEATPESDEDNLKMPHVRERQVIARDIRPDDHGDNYNQRLGSHSPNMYTISRKEAEKRSDLPRYDVRNVIERKKKVKSSKRKRDRDDSRSPRSPYSKSPVNRLSPRSRSRSLTPRGRKHNNSKTRRKKRNKNKNSNRGRSRSRSRSFSQRSFRSFSRSLSKSRSPQMHDKRKKSNKNARNFFPRSPSPRNRKQLSPIRGRRRHSYSRSPSFEGRRRKGSGSNTRGRMSNSPIRGAVNISPPPLKGKRGRDVSSHKKAKKKETVMSKGQSKKTPKGNKKKQKNIRDDVMPNSPTLPSKSTSDKTKSGKKGRKSNVKGKNNEEKESGLKQPKKKRRTTSNFNELSINTHSSSVVEKEVYAAGDKIMVSVNFKSKPNTNAGEKVGKENYDSNATNKKPMVVIDCLASPYQVIEPSPGEIIDIYSDEDEFITGGLSSQTLDVNKQTPNKKQKKQKQPKSLQVLYYSYLQGNILLIITVGPPK